MNTQIKNVKLTILLILFFSLITYSVLFSTLILFITKKLNIIDNKASDITAVFLTLNFTLQIIGGWFSGRIFSHRSLLFIGLFLQTIGCVFLSFYDLLWGLSFYLGGTGFNLVCINCMLTQFFDSKDKSREKAFLYNYTAMNVGAFVGTAISGFFEISQHYNYLFLFAAFSNFITICILLFKWKLLKDQKTSYSLLTKSKKKTFLFLGIGLITILLLFLRWIVENIYITNPIVISIAIVSIYYMVYLSIKEKDKTVQKKLFAYLIFMLTGIVFWTLYLMIPMGLILFVENNIQRKIGSTVIPPQWAVNVTTVVIIISGPILAKYFKYLRINDYKVTVTTQFISSLFIMSLGFISLSTGILFSSAEGYTPLFFLVISLIFLGVGEVLFSPIGYAMIGQLVPKKNHGLAMGIMFLMIGVGAVLANTLSKLAIGSTVFTSPLQTNHDFFVCFNLLSILALSAALILLMLSKKINSWIKE